MSLRKPFPTLDTFSMSSMTDVVFLLLIFFLVTSTFVQPSAMDVNLPQSGSQTQLRPVTEVYLDSLANLWIVADRNDSTGLNSAPRAVSRPELLETLAMIAEQDSLRAVALYADKTTDYGNVVEILDMASRRNLRMVLATTASKTAGLPAATQPAPSDR